MKFTTAALVGSWASSVTASVRGGASPLDVNLKCTSNSKIEAVITNVGNQDVNLFYKNTFLDERPVDRVEVTVDGVIVPSNGFRIVYAHSTPQPEWFRFLAAGESHQVEFDIAETHHVHTSPHDAHEVVAKGWFSWAQPNTTKIVGRLPFSSNQLSMNIDRDEAAAVFANLNQDHAAFSKRRLESRAHIDDAHCSADQALKLTYALRGCNFQAYAAWDQIKKNHDDARFKKWFTKWGDEYWEGIADRFGKISNACTEWTDRSITVFCRDPGSGKVCNSGDGIRAFVRNYSGQLVVCPSFWTSPLNTFDCSLENIADTQTGTIIHEFGHFGTVYGPPCQDYAYTAAAAQGLPAVDAYENCESYSFYAADLHAEC